LIVFAALLVSVLRAAPAHAQAAGTGTLTGTVTDASDKRPLGDAVVTATSPDLQGEQVVVTDAAGFFRIPDLPSGTYTLRFEKDGYKTATRDGIGLRTDSTLRVNAVLLPEVIRAEEVTVEARAPVIDVGSSSVGQNINSDFVKRVPVASPDGKGGANRSFEAVAEVTPGAKQDYNGSGVSFAGSSSPENNYVIDGLSVGNPGFGVVGTPLSTEFVKETNVISGGYMPEYGRTMGGVLNVVTKSGSNEYHGGFFSYFTPGGLAGTPKSVSVLGAGGFAPVVSSQKLSYVGDVGADVGGPIIRDKLWFYTGFDLANTVYSVSRYFQQELLDSTGQALQLGPDGNPVSQRIAGSDQSWDATSLGLQAIAKLTWAVSQDNKLTGTFIAAPNWSGGAGKFGIDPVTGSPDASAISQGTYSSIAHILNSSAYDASIKWSSEFDNKRILVDTTAGYHYEESVVIPSDGSLPGATSGVSSIPAVAWYGPNHSVADLERDDPRLLAILTRACTPTPQAILAGISTLCPIGNAGYFAGGTSGVGPSSTGRNSVDSYFRVAVGSTITYLLQAAGHHVMKAGFNVEFTEFDHTKSHSGGFDMNEGSNPLTGAPAVVDTEGFGTLVGPDNPVFNEPWRVKPKSIIAGGFVQDSWSVLDLVTLNVGLRYDAQTIYSADGNVGISMPNQWSPRVGLIWDPTQQGRSKLFANYARYYENMPLSIAEASLTGEGLLKASHPALDNSGNIPGICDVRTPPYCNNATGRSIQSSTTPSQYWQHSGFGQDPVDPDTQATSVDDIVAGAEYEIFKDGRLGVTYQRRWINRWIEDMSADGRNTFFIGNPGYGWASIFPKAERQYDAGTIYLQKVFANDWLASLSYTASYLRGNIPGLDSGGGNHGGYFDAPELAVNANGPLASDNSHDIKLFGAKDWVLSPHNTIATGVSARATSGAPTSLFGADIFYSVGTNYLIQAGTGKRLPWLYNFDVNLGYKYSFDRDRSVAVGVDVFNLFNLQEVTGVDQNYTTNIAVGKQNGTLNDVHVIDGTRVRSLYTSDVNTNYGNATSYQAPRIIRFNLRGTF
jgi:hypothetical protein